MNFVLGLGTIGGAFTVGNVFEHRANATKEIEEFKNSDNGVKRAQADAAKAKIDVAQ
ncbi:MAG: hypothetical protein ACI8R9_001921 [Paraglaciecola sp.]|jgi:hypothetical protein